MTTTRAARPAPRAVTVVVVVALLVGAVLAVSSRARAEFAASTQRQPEPYLELTFVDQEKARSCPVSDGRMVVSFKVRSHLEHTATLRFGVQTGAFSRGFTSGTVTVQPGATAVRTVRVAVPRKGVFRVVVSLRDRTERLSLVCGGGPAS